MKKFESWICWFLSCTDISLSLSLSPRPPLQTELFIHSPPTSSSSFCYFSNSCWSNCVPLLPPALTMALHRFPLALFSPCSSFPTSQYADWASESSPSKGRSEIIELDKTDDGRGPDRADFWTAPWLSNGNAIMVWPKHHLSCKSYVFTTFPLVLHYKPLSNQKKTEYNPDHSLSSHSRGDAKVNSKKKNHHEPLRIGDAKKCE